MTTLTDQDNGRRLPVRVGDVVTLRLTENASTGYRWAPDAYNAGLVELVEATASYPKTATGSGGEAVFRFRAIGVGSSALALKCWRHWDGEGSIVRRFAVMIEADP
jgi:inhibitor of cysteine peptidase